MTKVDCQTFWKSGNIIINLGWSHLLSKFLLLLLSFHLFIQLFFRLKTPKSDVTPWRQLELIIRGLRYRSSHSNNDKCIVDLYTSSGKTMSTISRGRAFRSNYLLDFCVLNNFVNVEQCSDDILWGYLWVRMGVVNAVHLSEDGSNYCRSKIFAQHSTPQLHMNLWWA